MEKTLPWRQIKKTSIVCFNAEINKSIVDKNNTINYLEAFCLHYFYRQEQGNIQLN